LAETCGKFFGFGLLCTPLKKNELSSRGTMEIQSFLKVAGSTNIPLSPSSQINEKAPAEKKNRGQGFLVTFWPPKSEQG